MCRIYLGHNNVFSFYCPLFEPEAFHTGNYTEITQQYGGLFTSFTELG